MSEKVTANFNNRKHIRWSNRLSSKNKAENKNKNQLEHKQIIPIRIAKIVTKNIQVEFMKQPDIKEITLIVEFSNDTLEIVNPTKIE